MKTLFKLLLVLLLLISSANAQVLQSQCNNIIGQAFDAPAGSMNCTPYPLNPSIFVTGVPVTRCFSYQYFGPINLSYLLVTGQCGPFALYNTLTFTIYNQACDTLIVTGSILPTNSNTYIDYLVPGDWYTICYTWVPNCPQTDACPLIFTSLLPIELLYFDIEYDSVLDCTILSWATASELNSDYFLIKKSYDGINFKDAIRVPAAGTTSDVTEYMAVNCENDRVGNIYYKLIEVDIDGKETEYAIESINVVDDGEEIMEVYDMTGKRISKLQPGLNIIKKNNKYYKIVKLD